MKKLPVLLISGWAHGAEAMSPLAEAVRDSHPLTSLSLADLGPRRGELQGNGVGGTAAQGAAAPVSAYARAVVRRLEEFDEPSCLIGWSTGGIVAIEAAACSPQKAAGLVLLGATARFCAEAPAKDLTIKGPATKDSAEEYSAGIGPAALRAMIRRLKKEPEETIADFFLQASFPMTIPADELALRTKKALGPGKGPLIDGLEYLAGVDLRSSLRSIGAPCLVIHGRQDRIVPWRAARFLGSNLPLALVELLPSAGHLLIEQCGKDLIDRTAQFVESLP